ncbi:MAG TPA: hypothetical protein VK105_21645 [Virgibacillus sp.]|nr:hypothetical protein [Virgibacillus sp.]HLR69701.1 hypothetical protein [Virgibacillus sp.]
MLNLGSLLLGIIAWVVPFLAMKHPSKKCFNFIIFSFSACIASLCLQLFEINNRVQLEDWSALMDTIGTLIWVAVILAVITIILNIIAVVICTQKETKI